MTNKLELELEPNETMPLRLSLVIWDQCASLRVTGNGGNLPCITADGVIKTLYNLNCFNFIQAYVIFSPI